MGPGVRQSRNWVGFNDGVFIGVGPWLHASNYVQGRLDVRASMTYLTPQLPRHEQALAARVFRLNRHTIAARVFNRNHHAID
jgi:hypothetical protein